MNKTRDKMDWTLFWAASLLWAGAYALTRGAAHGSDGVPPALVVPARLIIGATILNIIMFASGRRYPSLRDPKRWCAIAGMGLTGMTLPFLLITFAQKTVDSSLAALYVAAVPIFVAFGANILFEDEKVTLRVAIGIGLGFIGVIALFGPEAYQHFGSASVYAQILLLISAMFYAMSTLIARASPHMDPLIFSAGFVTIAALFAMPSLLTLEDTSAISITSIQALCILGLGIGPSALASLAYVAIVQRAGATFLALTGYSVPVVSAILGYVIFGETQSWNALLAFALILSGVWLAQSRKKSVTTETSLQSP